MQSARRDIVYALLSNKGLNGENMTILRDAFAVLTDSHTDSFQREMQTVNTKLLINIKDETTGLKVFFRFL